MVSADALGAKHFSEFLHRTPAATKNAHVLTQLIFVRNLILQGKKTFPVKLNWLLV
jgi:hypothetical protein